jgi:ankyrin repeat protein
VIRNSLPTRARPDRPDLDQLKRQAKELLDAFRAGEPDASAEVTAHYRDPDKATFALHDAQLVMARAYGFESWPKLKACVEGATDQRLIAAVRARDLQQVRAMLQARPELSGRSSALHVAVMERAPELVRVLMQHGANARVGMYPHRDATNSLTIAAERGYDEIVAIIREEEQRRQQTKRAVGGPTDELFAAIRSGDDDRAVALMESAPALIRVRHPVFDGTPLLLAAQTLNVRLVTWLLDHGADVKERGLVHPFDDIERTRGDAGQTPLDAAAYRAGLWGEDGDSVERFAAVADRLLKGGAALTARAAVALGNAEWLRAKHAEGTLVNRIEESGGLLRIAASHNRPEILALLLEFGFDPDERTRFRDVGGDEVVFTWGMPLWQCAASGKYEMAEMLLAHGADPNADVYASGTPLNQAYGRRDRKMVELLERHGGRLDAGAVGSYRLTDRAKQMLADVTNAPLDEGGQTVAEQLLRGGACGGDPEIVRLALEHVDWPRTDPRWFSILEQPLRIWNHGSRFWANNVWDRRTYLTCFRLVLERCDPNLRGRVTDGQEFGLTILHSVAGSREHVTAGERVAFALVLLDAGARLDLRDDVLKSTPLGWACRWGRLELVKLYLERGADPLEADAEPWATPLAWAQKKGHAEIEDHLRRSGGL